MSENRQHALAAGVKIDGMEILDREACYRVFQTHDARFDGRIFVGVTSTGIYCRPICPARTPKFANCRYFASAAAAQEAGFRPCLRCRPETAPELAFWRGSSQRGFLAIPAPRGSTGPSPGPLLRWSSWRRSWFWPMSHACPNSAR